MKQRCWKQLKNLLCPPQKWIKDSQQSKCQCCSKQFRLLVRRRHHCRFCGNLFCSECSDYFINGNYIGQTNEKYIRHCEFCHKKIEKFIREWTKMPQIYEEKHTQNTKDEEVSDDEQEDQNEIPFNLNKMFEEVQKTTCEFNQILGEKQTKILNEGAQALCDKFNLDKDIWKQKLVNLAQKVVVQAKMEVLVSEGSPDFAMDISKRVKVRAVQTSGNKAVQAMVKGIVLQKNLSSKSMQTHLSNPRVLVIENSIDLDSLASFIKFQQLIKNDKAIMKKILEKIVKLNPHIIFVQNNVHVYALQYLQSKQIVVINKLKQKQLLMIKQVTGIKKSIKKLWMLEKYKHQWILGKCDKIYFKTVRQGQMMMFIEAAEMGIRTILLGEQNEEETSNLKKSMKILMKLARQLNLQKHFILIQKQLKDGIGKKECIFPAVEDFNPIIYQNIQTFLLNQEISYSKILYYPIKLSQSPKNFQQYALRIGKYSYKQICGKVQFLTKKTYTNSDFTLGAYILMKAANFERLCKKCQNNHKEQYYLNDYIITIDTEKKLTSIPQKSSSSTLIQMAGQQFTLQKLKNHLTKQKQLVVISSCVKCQICRCTVGLQNVKVGKWFLSNSFHHILHNIVLSYDSIYQQFLAQKSKQDEAIQANRKGSRRKLSMDRCEHSLLIRVFEYAGFQIKINIDKASVYHIDYIDLTRKQSLQYILYKEKKYVKSIYESQLLQKVKILQKILAILTGLPFPVFSSSMSLSQNDKVIEKVMLYYQSSIHLKDILESCKTELKEVQAKSREQLEKTKHDWTVLTRRILKVESILQIALLIINEIERALTKKKSDNNTSQVNSNTEISAVMTEYNDNLTQNNQVDEVSDYSPMVARNSIIMPESFLDEETREYLKKKSKKIFPRVNGTFFRYHTANIQDPVSLLAVGINSNEYRRICDQEINISPMEFTFRMNGDKRLKTDWPLRAETDKIYNEVVGQLVQKIQTIDITVYYPKEFETFRKNEGIDNELYVRGLCTCKSWNSSGGKSNSFFSKAENDLLVVKVINEKQFDQFLKFAKDYIEYMKTSKNVGRDTLLAKIFGIYEVMAKGKAYKCIVMQNIFFGLQNISKVYDLKGSQVNRLNLPPENVEKFTGQDTNFKIDKQGQPYVLRAFQYDRMIKILQQDSNFLKQHAVIDYSLLVIQNKDSLRIGIIDYMRPYQLMEKLETFYKEFKSGRDPTVIPPNSYADRFIGAMKKYFLKIQ